MTDWAIPQQAKLKYTQLFNLHDRSRSGFLSGLQCRDILMQSGLPRNILAEIWNLSDIDGDGQLTREEFILAMHLTNQVRAGQTLPQELPPDLVPPSYRRTRSISATSVHSTASAASSASSGVAMAPTPAAGAAPPAPAADDPLARKSTETGSATTTAGSMLNSNSFEDKRRENFEKGRAELERRRLKMIEQQSSVISEQLVRCKKQVAEAKSKIDSMRSDRDTKAGLITSLEAQLKTVRDRQAFLDQEELQIIAMARDLNLVNSPHSAELDQQATQAKQESIAQMKEKLVDMEREKETKLKQLAEAQTKLDDTKRELQAVSEEASKVYENYKEKVANAKVLREQFLAETKAKPIDLDSAWDAAPSSQRATSPSLADPFKPEPTSAFPVATEDPWASSRAAFDAASNGGVGGVSSKPAFDDSFAFSKNNSTPTPANDLFGFNNNNDSNFEPARDYSSLSNLSSKSNEPPAASTQGTTIASNSFGEPSGIPEATSRRKMYRALYEFEARNPDELTMNPGDIITGSEVVCEPGWLSGEANGKSGLFPEAYVEPLPADEYPPEEVQPPAPQQQQQATTIPNPPAATTTTTTAIVKYKVIYAFEARNPDELTINPGDIITGVDAPHEPGWLMGELNGQRGLFPEPYVERFAEAAAADQAATGPGTLRRGSSSGSLRSKKSRAKKAEVATVIANYRALGQEQLSLEKGQLVLVRRKMDSGWWEGELQIKDKAKQPSNSGGRGGGSSSSNGRKPLLGDELDHLINELVDSELDYVNDLRLCQSAYIGPLSGSFDVSQMFSNWGAFIERHEKVLKSIHDKFGASTRARSLEYTFVLDQFQLLLTTITELYVDFCARQNESARQLDTKIASDVRFRQLVSESQRKLRRLIERQEAIKGITGREYDQEVGRALRNSNLPVTSFLLKPMQRITRYGLLFDRMLKAIDKQQAAMNGAAGGASGALVRQRVEALRTAAHTLCKQVNETCRLKEDEEENVRRLRWCQNHIRQQTHQLVVAPGQQAGGGQASALSSADLRLLSGGDFIGAGGRPVSLSDSLSSSNGGGGGPAASPCFVPVEQIIFNSNTHCLGPRRLLKAATMIKMRSGRELMVFLFTDFLLLAQVKSGANQRVEDLFRSERAQQAYYKPYRWPIMLEDLQLDNYDNYDLVQQQLNARSLICPSPLSNISSSNTLQKGQESLLVSFLDRPSGTTYNLIAMNMKEKKKWAKLLTEHTALAREAHLVAQQSLLMTSGCVSPRRPLSASESMGRLFVTVLELVRVSSTAALAAAASAAATPPLPHHHHHHHHHQPGVDQLNLSWDRRRMSTNSCSSASSSQPALDLVQNLSVRLQLKLYKRTQMLLDEEEIREIVPTSDEFRTRPIVASQATRQPAMADMNESMSSLDLQRDVFKFHSDSETTQFLLGPNDHAAAQPGSATPSGNATEYLEIELMDESRFRETRQLGRKRVNLDQLLGRGVQEPQTASCGGGGAQALARNHSTRSVRGWQVLEPNRPIEMTFKLKSVGGDGTKSAPVGASPLTAAAAAAKVEADQQKFSVKLKLHLQLFCDINNLF